MISMVSNPPGFSLEPCSRDFVDAFRKAIVNKDIKTINQLMSFNVFKEIPPEDLGDLICDAIDRNFLEVADLLVASPRFAEIPLNHLKSAFASSIKYGHRAFLTAFIDSHKFDDFPAADLVDPLTRANDAETLKVFVQWGKFAEKAKQLPIATIKKLYSDMRYASFEEADLVAPFLPPDYKDPLNRSLAKAFPPPVVFTPIPLPKQYARA